MEWTPRQRPSVRYCENPDCHAPLVRGAHELHDNEQPGTVVYCDDCARSALKHYPRRFRVAVRSDG